MNTVIGVSQYTPCTSTRDYSLSANVGLGMRQVNTVEINMNKGRCSNGSDHSQPSCSQSTSSQQSFSKFSQLTINTPINTPISRITSMSENSQHHEGNSRKRTRTVCDMDGEGTVCDMDGEDVGRFFAEQADCEDDVDDFGDDEANDSYVYDNKFVKDTDKIVYEGKHGEDSSIPYEEESSALYQGIKSIQEAHKASIRNKKKSPIRDYDIIENIMKSLSELSQKFDETSIETLNKEERRDCCRYLKHGTI